MSKFPFRRASALSLAIAAALTAPAALANWPTDPANNLLIAQHNTGDQVAPHMVATPDGGFYVSWLDAGATYSIRLQRIDVDGNLMWGANGILVYARNEQYTFDYGLDVDAAGNALLAFDSSYVSPIDGSHQPGGNIIASKVAPDGTLLWGSAGIQVSPPGETEYLGKITGTTDGGAVVAWFNAASNAVVQKFSAAGTPLWATPATFTAGGGAFIADIHGSDNGNAIISIRASSAGALLTQKLASADGSPMWGANPVTLSDGSATTGGLQLGYAPPFVNDGAGGAVYTWYVTKGVQSATTRVQHVSAAGIRLFPDNSFNGADVSTNNGVDGVGTDVQVIPSGTYDLTTGDTYVMFEEQGSSGTAPAATFAQRFNSAGERQWTDNGLQLEDYIPLGQTFPVAVAVPGGLIAAWASSNNQAPTKLQATRVNADASYAWSSVPVAVKTSSSQISRISGMNSTQGYAAFVWEEGVENQGSDIRAQNLRYDSLLGKQIGVAPGVPSLTAATDSGASNSDKITNNPTPAFAGSCNTNGDGIGIAVDGALVATGTCSGGTYTIALSSPPTDAAHTVKAYEFSVSGSSSFSAASAFTMDTTAPVINLTTKPGTGVPPTSSSSSATFAFTVDGPQATQCQLDGGAFAPCTSPVQYDNLLVGSHTFTVQATDVAGNTGSTVYTWTVQPDPVVVNLDPSSDSGRSNSDLVTNANPLLFTGPCTDGDVIKVFAGAATLGTATCGSGPLGSGMYSVSGTIATDGNKSISATATRGAFTNAPGPILHVTIDRHAPAAPTITDPSGTVGASAMVSGSAEINSIVAVIDNGTVLCTALTDGTGSWSCNAPFPAAGTNTLTATATDVAGNTSAASTPFDVTVSNDLVFRNGFDG
jgi:hypothetical protein